MARIKVVLRLGLVLFALSCSITNKEVDDEIARRGGEIITSASGNIALNGEPGKSPKMIGHRPTDNPPRKEVDDNG